MAKEGELIIIRVNGTSTEVAAGICLSQFVALRGLLQTEGIAVAVNNKVVRRAQWDTTELLDGDSVVLLTAVQGG